MSPVKPWDRWHGSTVFLVVLLVVAVSTASVLFFLKDGETRDKQRVSKELDGLALAEKKLEADLQALQVASAALKEKTQYQEERLASVARDLEEQRLLRQKAEAAIAVKEGEIGELRKQIQRAGEEKKDLEGRLEKQYEDYYLMKNQLSDMLKTKEALEQKAKELAENGPVSLGTVIVRSNRNGGA